MVELLEVTPDVFDVIVITNHCWRDEEAECHSNLTNRTNVRIEVATAIRIKTGCTTSSFVNRL